MRGIFRGIMNLVDVWIIRGIDFAENTRDLIIHNRGKVSVSVERLISVCVLGEKEGYSISKDDSEYLRGT